MGKKFACRTCRREVTLDENGVANHLDGSPACIMEIAGKEMADWDRHEIVEDESSLSDDVASQLQGEEMRKEKDG